MPRTRVAGAAGVLVAVLLLAMALTPAPLARSTAVAAPVEKWSIETPPTMPTMRGLPDVTQIGADLARLIAPPPLEPMQAPWAAAPVWNGVEPPPIAASAVAVLDEASMALLAARDEHERRAPASLTKIVTAALAVQSGALDDIVDNEVESWEMPGSSLMGLHPGDEFTLRDLSYGLMLMSGNDAALSIARALRNGNVGLFVHHMNAMAAQLGLQDTHFTDPHGLGGPEHYSSAYDLAVLARYAMQFRDFRQIASTPTWTASGSRTISMTSYVEPFLESYPGGEGMKTGYTVAAGPTFVGSAVRDGHRVYVVLLNSGNRFGDASALLDWAFENYTWPASPPLFVQQAASAMAMSLSVEERPGE